MVVYFPYFHLDLVGSSLGCILGTFVFAQGSPISLVAKTMNCHERICLVMSLLKPGSSAFCHKNWTSCDAVEGNLMFLKRHERLSLYFA